MADVVVVDDSRFMRAQIKQLLEDRGHSVIAEAHNGKAGVDAVEQYAPDVVTMDVKMPGMDGIDAAEAIMESNPTPILMLSRYTADGANITLEALDNGAVDFFIKREENLSSGLVQSADDLAERVEIAAGVDVSQEPSGTVQTEIDQSTPFPQQSQPETPPTLVVAASTGGPPVVKSMLSALPATYGFRVLVVQHMPSEFTSRFAERLEAACELSVSEAATNRPLTPNGAVVAKGGYHLTIGEETGSSLDLKLRASPPVHNVRPAADVTFESVAKTVTGPLVAIVLSGMGKDGAAGIEAVAEVGGTTIVQDPETARISGMPNRAIETGVVDAILPPEEMPARILNAVSQE